METQKGVTVAQLNQKQDVLLVFLRFFGCTFCREAISDLSSVYEQLKKRKVRLVFVHMARDPELPDSFFTRYQMPDVDHVCDPACYFYQQFGLVKSTPGQLVSFGNWIRGFQSAVIEGHGFSIQNESLGDGFQMPGVFFIRSGQVANSFIHKMPFDRPDYLKLVQESLDD
jgi:AhpC/TSA family